MSLTLGLEILLQCLKPDISQPSWDQAAEERGTLDADILLLPQRTEDMLGEYPEYRYHGIEQGQNEETPLQEDTQVMLVRRSRKATRRQCV